MIEDQTLFGLVDKVEIAIERIRTFEPPEGYYVAFSGGKDSCVILDLVKRAGVKFDAHYNLTTVDPPELVYFIREKHPEVEVHHPELTMWELIPKKLMPPTRIVRYCCKTLKEGGGIGRTVVTGIRHAESNKRSKRGMVEQCRMHKRKTYLHPIIDWSEGDVWEYIKSNDMPYCCLYDEGFRRLGCVLCPMKGPAGMLRDVARWPKIAQAYEHAFDRMIQARTAAGKQTEWKTGAEVMHWWIHNPPKGNPKQYTLFEEEEYGPDIV